MLLKVYKSRAWLMLLMLLPFVGTVQAQVSPWDFTENPTSGVYAITTSVVFDGVDALAPGDWVGAFYMDNGVLECGGAAEWLGTANTAVVAFGNDTLEAPNKNGFSEGEMVHWKFYRSATSTEEDVLSTPEFFWTNGALEQVTGFYVEETGCEQTISVVSGFNWISFNCLPDPANVNGVLANYDPADGDIFKNATATVTYFGGTWYPTSHIVNPDSRYLLQRTNVVASEIEVVDGVCVDATVPINLVTGWNWLGYKPAAAQLVNDAFTLVPPATDGDVIKSATQTITYFGGTWYPTSATMNPGTGYMISLATGPSVLTYNTSADLDGHASVAPVQSTQVKGDPGWITVGGHQYNMTVYVQITVNGTPIDADGSSLAAFKDDECRGQSYIFEGPLGKVWALTPGSNLLTEPGFTMKVWDAATDKIYDLNESFDFENNAILGQIFAPLQYTVVASEFGSISGLVTDATTTDPIDGATVTATWAELPDGVKGDPGWITVGGHQYNMTVYVQITVNGTSIDADGSSLAAFKDGECRGQSYIFEGPLGKVWALTPGSNLLTEPGFTMKVWDAATDKIYDLNESFDFENNAILGQIFAPLQYTAQGDPPVPGPYVALTDEFGVYVMDDVVPGLYDMTATHPDYEDGEALGAEVVAGVTTIQDFALVPIIACEDVVINNFPAAPADVCFGEAVVIDFSGVEVLNAASVTWSVYPVTAGAFDGTTFTLDPGYVGMVTVTVFGEATPPCADATASLSFEVFALPFVECPTFEPVCAGSEMIEFAPVEGGVYTDAGANVVTGFDPVDAGSFGFTLTVIDENGCSASCEFSIVVDALPVVTCPVIEPLCAGSDPITFPAVAGGVYTDAGANVVTGFDPMDAGSFVFMLTVTDENGCSGSCEFSIMVNEVPVAECPGDDLVCEGSEYIVFPEVLDGVYTNEAGDVVIGFNPAMPGTYMFYLTVTNEFGCTDMCEFEIEVMALPIPYAGPNATIGTEDTYTLAEAAIENLEEDDFWWWTSSGDGTFDPDLFALNATYVPSEGDIAAGSVELCLNLTSFMCGVDVVDCMTLFIGGGCINPPTAFAGEDMVVCADGEPIELDGSVEYAELFFWSTLTGSGEFSDEYTLNPTYTPGEGDYLIGSVELCLTAIGLEGCPDAVDCMTITFNALPVVTLVAYEPVCEGSEAFDLYGGMPEGGTYFVDGAEAVTFNPEMAGEYDLMYTYTDENGCSNSAMGMIVVLELPEVTLVAYAPVCEGSEAFDLYGGLPEGGTYFVDYVQAVTFNPAMAGQYDLMYMYTDENGCTNFATGIILVNPLPVVECPVFAPVCEGSEMIEFDVVEGGVYYDVTGTPVEDFDPVMAGEYEFMLEVTNEFGCSASCTFTIVVNPLPYLIYEPAVFTMCLGEEIDVTITGPEDGAYPYAVEFMINGELMTDVIEESFNVYQLEPEMAGTWSLEVISVTDANGCVAAENSAFEVEVLPLTAITTQPMDVEVVYGQPFELTVEAENATGYQWYFEGAMIAGANTDTYTVEAAMLADGGTYYVMVFGECGDVMSAEVTVTITPETQTIDFLGAVNGMSTYLELIEDDMATILAPVLNDLYYVEMKNPAMVWTPSNTSFDFNENKGAKVILNSGYPTFVEVEGFPTLGASVSLPAGSSFLPVRSRDVVSAADVFEPLGDALFAVFSMDYAGIYWPSIGEGVYTLQNLIPGSAYLIVMNEPAIADFDVLPAKAAVAKYVNVPANMTSWNDMVLTATQHNIAITADALQGLQIGDVIGAFNEYGQIAGMIEVTNLRDDLVLRAFGDNPATEAVEGFVEGDLITFKVWRNGVEIAAEATFTSDMPNQNVFAKDGISAVEGLKAGVTAVNDLSNEFTANLYPNPATDVVNINTNFVISNIKVINYVGQVIFENNPEQEDFQINTSNLVSGMYFVQIESNEGYVITKRLTIK